LAGNVQSTVSKTVNINQLPVWGNNPGFDANVSGTVSCLGGKNIRFDANASDADAGQTLKFFVCSNNDANYQGCVGGSQACSSTGSSSNPSCVYAQPADDSLHTWYGFVFDSLNEGIGSSKSKSYTCDSTLPVVTLQLPSNASSSSDNTPDFTANPSETVSNCYLQVSTNPGFTSIVSGYDGIDVGSACDYNAPSALGDGTYYWRMKATDVVGNVGNYDVNWSFSIDTNGVINTAIVSVAGDSSSPYWDVVNDSQTSVVVSGESGMSCRWGTEDVVYSSMSNDCSVAGVNATCNLGSLTQAASYARFISCKDSVGNEQTTAQNVNLTFGVDWTAPSIGQTAITSNVTATHVQSPANIESSVVSDSVSLDNTTCQYTLNGSSWVSGTWSAASSKCVDNSVVLNDGSNAINYRISDSAGNVGTGTAITRTKDNDAPTGTTLGFGAITVNSITASVSNAADSGAGLHSTPYYFEETVTVSNSGWQAGTSWSKASLDANTSYSFRVKAKDALGNESSFTAVQSRFTLANIPGTPTVNAATVSSLNVAVSDVNSNPAGTGFRLMEARVMLMFGRLQVLGELRQ
jgi:hypothetical protein